MKTFYHLNFKNSVVFLFLIFAFAVNSQAQTPQYFNANSGGIGNFLPFGAATGYKTQWLIGPGEYNQPTPAPAGNIPKLYIYMSNTAGPATFSNLTIKFGQTELTTLPTGGIYTGQLDTVYYATSVTLSSALNTWMSIILDTSFRYNPAQSLVIEASHCGLTGTGSNVWQSAGTTGIIRRNNIPGTTTCVFTYSGQDTRTLQCGIDVVPLVGVVNNNNEIPNEYKLEQNYPNPFNPTTKINFSIPKSSNVKLKVSDALGKDVATLVNEFLDAGNYEVNFDGSNFSSGVYFYSIVSDNFSDQKKMYLVK